MEIQGLDRFTNVEADNFNRFFSMICHDLAKIVQKAMENHVITTSTDNSAKDRIENESRSKREDLAKRVHRADFQKELLKKTQSHIRNI